MTIDPVLLEPLRVGAAIVPNRLFVSSHSYGFTDGGGHPTQKLIDYVSARARGGVGLIILGETQVGRVAGTPGFWGACESDDSIVPFYRELRRAVRSHGPALVFEQLSHPGGQVWPQDGAIAVAPSAVAQPISGLTPRELRASEMIGIVDQFAAAARRVRAGGLDGVELKLDQGKLLHQFLSPAFNRRRDDYGPPDGGLRYVREVLAAVRSAVGSDFPVGVRLTWDVIEQTNGWPDIDAALAARICAELSSTGEIDYCNVNGGTNSNPRAYRLSHGDESVSDKTFVTFAEAARSATDLPLFVAGKILNLEDAAAVIRSDAADLVAMTRAHIADPYLIRKARAGRAHRIRPCVSCNQGCIGNTWEGLELRCLNNPAVGFEAELDETLVQPSDTPRRVAVIGGGPAGLEAARVAAAIGHEVTLFERSERLGGQVRYAATLSDRARLLEVVAHLERELEEGPRVAIEIGLEISSLDALAEFEVAILATGAGPSPASFPSDGSVGTRTLLDVLDDLSRNEVAGLHFLLLDEEWRLNCLGVGSALIARGAQVTVATTQEFIGKGLDLVTMTSQLSHLRLDESTMYTFAAVEEVVSGVVLVRDLISGLTFPLDDIDVVVPVVNFLPRRELVSPEGADALPRLLEAGDCVFARGIEIALREGRRAALAV